MVANPNKLRATVKGASNIDLSRVIWEGSEMEAIKKEIDSILDTVTYNSGETQEEILTNATTASPALVSVIPEGTFENDILKGYRNEIQKSKEDLNKPGVREKLLESVLSDSAA